MNVRANRILILALVLSAAAHVIFALSVRPMPALAARREPPPTRVTIVHRPPPPLATPTPAPPKPHVAVHPSHAARSAPFRPKPIAATNVAHAISEPPETVPATAGPAAPGPEVAGTASPQPSPEPKPACSTPFAPAVATDPVAATVPDGFDGSSAVVQVRVTLDAAGNVTGTAIYRSAGNVMLDRAALAAARMSRYRAEIRDCEPAGGSYLFTVDFQS